MKREACHLETRLSLEQMFLVSLGTWKVVVNTTVASWLSVHKSTLSAQEGLAIRILCDSFCME